MSNDIKVFYADQPAGFSTSAGCVARLAFGVIDDDALHTTVTIAMPMESLIMMVNDLTAMLNNPRFKQSSILAMRRAIASIEDGVDGTPSIASTHASLMGDEPKKSRAKPKAKKSK